MCVCACVCVCVCVCVHDQWHSTGKQRIIVIRIIQSKICTCTTSRVFALSLTHTECSAWESKRRGMQRTCGSLLCLLKAFKLPSFFWSHIRASWSRAVLCVVCTRVENATFVMDPSFTGTHTHTQNIHSYGWMMMKMSCQDMYLRACRVHISTFTIMSASPSGDTRARVSIYVYIYICVCDSHAP